MGPFVVLRRIAVPFQEFAMKKLVAAGLLLAFTNTIASDSSLLDQEFRYLASEETVNLGKEFQGKVLLIVNTASKCGNTPQYEGLEKLYEEYGDRGLVVLGFPSNDFLGQEPGTEEEIQEFCRLTYKVRLAAEAGTHPTWNFHKYLIGRDGKLITEFSPRTKPYDPKVVAKIEEALGS